MTVRRELALRSAILVAALVIGIAPATPGQPARFNAFLDPEFQRIAVGETARVAFAVDGTASGFNGYEVTFRFDPVTVDVVDLEQGQLMLDFCGNNWWFTTETDSTVFISHVTLCAGVRVEGPGELSVLTFEGLANGLTEIEILTDPDFLFFDGGIYINPSHPTMPRQVMLETAWVAVGPNEPPGCDAGGTYVGDVGETLTLDGSSSGDDVRIDSYLWEFGDGSTGEGWAVQHVWETAAIYTVTLCVIDNEGAGACCTTTARIEPVIGIDDPGRMPAPLATRLDQNRPNPFNPTTEIVFELKRASPVRLVISSVLGRVVWQRRWDHLPTGEHRVQWSARLRSGESLPSGLYVYELEAGGLRLSRKMLLVQ